MIKLGKNLLITEKPSVAMEFAKALKITTNRKNGYLESDKWIITWCVGHLVTMSYPEKYDEKLRFWRLDTLPFIPTEWKYEIIPAVKNQFNIVKELLQREDVEEIYNAGDSGREGEYIQRLVFMMAKPNLLLLDEPSLGLAPLIISDIFKMICKIRDMGVTILLVEQNARMALKISDRGYVLETGKIALCDDAKALLHSDLVRKAYLGKS